MTWKPLAAFGALLVVGGVALFLAGAMLLTRNARHGDINPAVYWGAGLVLAGVVLLLAAGLVAWMQRSGGPG
ncbi:MAG TPA: hypothetical protein VE981_18470 [Planctomycetota bacterium]|nr:hypothetical protein [Planctomycetota bacterium]